MSDRIAKEDYAVAKASLATFDQSANSSTATTVPAALNVGSLVLLSDAITAIATLQTGVNTNRQLLNKIIDILQAAGLAS